MYGDALLDQRSETAVLGSHHDPCRRLPNTGHVVGHIERASIIGYRATIATRATGCTYAITTGRRTTHAISAVACRTAGRGSRAAAASGGIRGATGRTCIT